MKHVLAMLGLLCCASAQAGEVTLAPQDNVQHVLEQEITKREQAHQRLLQILDQADQHLRQQRFDQAEISLQEADEIIHQTPSLKVMEDLVEALRQRVRQRNASAQDAASNSLLRLNPTARKHVEDGDRYWNAKDYPAALKLYEQAQEQAPRSQIIRERLARTRSALLQQEEQKRAEKKNASLQAVDQNWSTPRTTPRILTPASLQPIHSLQAKLNQWRLTEVNFNQAGIAEVVRYLRETTRTLDSEGIGANMIVHTTWSEPSEPKVTLRGNQLTVAEVLQAIAITTGLNVQVDEHAVWLSMPNLEERGIQTRTLTVRPEFLYTQGDWTQRLQQGDFEDVTDLLRTRGIPFDADAVATYFPHANKLVVRGREDALSLTERVINLENTFRLPQVEIETKFIEFSETQLNELRTRWQVNTRGVIPGMASVFPLDNTSGVGAETGGLRGFNPTDAITANAGITANTLDSLLLQGSNQTAPQASTLRFAGILNGRGVTLLINALQSTLGSNMLSAPRLTLKQGGEGTVKIVREFVYPQTYQRPQLPQEGVLTPGVPEDFNFEQPKDVGVTLTVRANQINPSQGFIDLNLINAQMVDFDGFINFGSDITSFNADTGQSERLVEGVALQPVFTVRRADTSVQLRDGEALLIGGLMREDTQQVADKVPVLGDIPLLGRAFRSNSEQKIKRHLIILCTATLIKPSEEPRP